MHPSPTHARTAMPELFAFYAYERYAFAAHDLFTTPSPQPPSDVVDLTVLPLSTAPTPHATADPGPQADARSALMAK